MRNSKQQTKITNLLKVFILELIFIQSTIFCFGNVNQKKIIVRVLDEHDQPTAARIRITGKDSVYYAPIGHRIDFPITEREGDNGRGGDVMLDNNRRFAYVDGICTINLIEKETIRFEVVKGYAYRFFDSTINILSNSDTINLRLEKWFEFPTGKKWYSGDVHTHQIDSATALLEMKAEDVNVCNI